MSKDKSRWWRVPSTWGKAELIWLVIAALALFVFDDVEGSRFAVVMCAVYNVGRGILQRIQALETWIRIGKIRDDIDAETARRIDTELRRHLHL